MMQKFDVQVKEVHYRHYEVTARHEEEAKRFVDERDDGTLSVKDIGVLEFSHEENKIHWLVDKIL